MYDPFGVGFQQRIVQVLDDRAVQIVLLVHDDLNKARERGLDGGACELGVALGGVRIVGAQKRALDRDRIVHRPALADAPVIYVASEIGRRNGIDDVRLLGRDPHGAEMRADGDTHALEHALVLLNRAVVHRHARIIDDLMDDTIRISLRYPAIVVDRLRPVAGARGVDLVDGDHLSRLRIIHQILVMEAPPGGGIAAEGLTLVVGIA